MLSNFKLHLAEITVLVLFLGIGFAVSITTPLLRGRDELAHFHFIRFIAQNHRLPLTWEERRIADYKSEWPPLFHLLAGAVGYRVDVASPPFVATRITQNNPRVQLVFGPDDVAYTQTLVTEDPYQGELLLWYLGRWVTLACGAVGLGVTYGFVRTVYPENSWVALSAVAVLALTLSYVRDSGVISYDPLLGVPVVLYLLLLFDIIRNPTRLWPYFGLGLLMGLAGLVKYTPLPAVVMMPALTIWLAYKNKWGIGVTMGRIALFAFGLCLTFGLWLFYMWFYFNRVADMGWLSGSLYPFLADNLGVGDQTSRWFAGLFTSDELGSAVVQPPGQDSLFDWIFAMLTNIWGAPWLAWTFIAGMVLAIAGLIKQWPVLDQTVRLWWLVLAVHLALFWVFPVLRFVSVREINTNTVAGQHIIFPAGAIVVLILVFGFRVWLKPAHLMGLFLLITVLLLGMDVAFVRRMYHSPLPVQATPLSNAEQPLATFQNIALLGYTHTVDNQALALTLYWRANTFSDQDYQTEITLQDSTGQPQAGLITQPVNGQYPTRAWLPGDRVRDSIYLPLAGLPPGQYQVELRVLGLAGPIAPTAGKFNTQMPAVINNGYLDLKNVSVNPASMTASNTIYLDGQEIGYTLGLQNVPPQPEAADLPLYNERSAILFTIPSLPADIQVHLLGPTGQTYEPVGHIGYIYTFQVEPQFARGQYQLRFEQRANGEQIAQADTPPLLQVYTYQRQFEPGVI